MTEIERLQLRLLTVILDKMEDIPGVTMYDKDVVLLHLATTLIKDTAYRVNVRVVDTGEVRFSAAGPTLAAAVEKVNISIREYLDDAGIHGVFDGNKNDVDAYTKEAMLPPDVKTGYQTSFALDEYEVEVLRD